MNDFFRRILMRDRRLLPIIEPMLHSRFEQGLERPLLQDENEYLEDGRYPNSSEAVTQDKPFSNFKKIPDKDTKVDDISATQKKTVREITTEKEFIADRNDREDNTLKILPPRDEAGNIYIAYKNQLPIPAYLRKGKERSFVKNSIHKIEDGINKNNLNPTITNPIITSRIAGEKPTDDKYTGRSPALDKSETIYRLLQKPSTYKSPVSGTEDPPKTVDKPHMRDDRPGSEIDVQRKNVASLDAKGSEQPPSNNIVESTDSPLSGYPSKTGTPVSGTEDPPKTVDKPHMRDDRPDPEIDVQRKNVASLDDVDSEKPLANNIAESIDSSLSGYPSITGTPVSGTEDPPKTVDKPHMRDDRLGPKLSTEGRPVSRTEQPSQTTDKPRMGDDRPAPKLSTDESPVSRTEQPPQTTDKPRMGDDRPAPKLSTDKSPVSRTEQPPQTTDKPRKGEGQPGSVLDIDTGRPPALHNKSHTDHHSTKIHINDAVQKQVIHRAPDQEDHEIFGERISNGIDKTNILINAKTNEEKTDVPSPSVETNFTDNNRNKNSRKPHRPETRLVDREISKPDIDIDESDRSRSGIFFPHKKGPVADNTVPAEGKKRTTRRFKKANEAPPENVDISVTIRSIDIRSTAPASHAKTDNSNRPAKKRSRPVVSLDDYLKQSNEGN